MKKLFSKWNLLFLAFVPLTSSAQVNTGEIRGKVLEKETEMGLPGANVWVEVSGEKFGTMTDSDGRFLIKPLNPGKYELNVTFMGYTPQKILLEVIPNQTTYANKILLEESAHVIGAIDVVTYTIPLIHPDRGSVTTMTYKELEKRPDIRNINAMVGTVGGVYTDGTGDAYVRGSRSDAAVYFIDGVKITGTGANLNVPGVAIGSLTVYTGGVPAKYGDVTSGVIIIETKSYFDLYREHNQ